MTSSQKPGIFLLSRDHFIKFRYNAFYTLSHQDTHIPALTVEQTLMTAAELAVPLEIPFRAEMIQWVLDSDVIHMNA